MRVDVRCGIQPTKLAIIGSPGKDLVVRPANRSDLAGSDTLDGLVSNRTRHFPRSWLDRLFRATAGYCFYDVSKLSEAIQAPTVNLPVLRENESMVLTYCHRFYHQVEARQGNGCILRVLSWPQTGGPR